MKLTLLIFSLLAINRQLMAIALNGDNSWCFENNRRVLMVLVRTPTGNVRIPEEYRRVLKENDAKFFEENFADDLHYFDRAAEAIELEGDPVKQSPRRLLQFLQREELFTDILAEYIGDEVKGITLTQFKELHETIRAFDQWYRVRHVLDRELRSPGLVPTDIAYDGMVPENLASEALKRAAAKVGKPLKPLSADLVPKLLDKLSLAQRLSSQRKLPNAFAPLIEDYLDRYSQVPKDLSKFPRTLFPDGAEFIAFMDRFEPWLAGQKP